MAFPLEQCPVLLPVGEQIARESGRLDVDDLLWWAHECPPGCRLRLVEIDLHAVRQARGYFFAFLACLFSFSVF